MSFTKKILTFTFVLVPNVPSPGSAPSVPKEFQTGSNTVTLSGLRATVNILKAAFPQMPTAQIAIFGMTKSQMNQLSTLGQRIFLQPMNRVIVAAGDADHKPATIFSGNINNAWIDFNAMPDVAFRVDAFTGLAQSVIPQDPTSVDGTADVVTILSSLANAGNMTFENNGVEGIQVKTLYEYGDIRTQIMRICGQVANQMGCLIDDGNAASDTLAIWPLPNGFRKTGQVPIIAPPPEGSMIGYPSFLPNAVSLRTQFNPNIGIAKQIQVKSSILANGNPTTWVTYGIDHALDTMFPHGKWETTIQAFDPKTGNAPVQK